jgi:uncharacterized protein (TIGR02145 family)
MLLIVIAGCKKEDDSPDPKPTAPTVKDIDGNVYHLVTIGTQVWMVENLKVTHYRNGEAIPYVSDNTEWSHMNAGAWCNYQNNETVAATYGRLYNWHTLQDSREVCPAGWHVPSDAEWTTLINYLGGESVAGGKMKEAGTAHWSYNSNATNESNFTALPGGMREHQYGAFTFLNSTGLYWTSNEVSSDDARAHILSGSYNGIAAGSYNKKSGLSVRCIKD